MLPEFLSSSYKQYKNDTSDFVTWLCLAIETCGYKPKAKVLEEGSSAAAPSQSSEALPAKVPDDAPSKTPAASQRLKGKVRKLAASLPSSTLCPRRSCLLRSRPVSTPKAKTRLQSTMQAFLQRAIGHVRDAQVGDHGYKGLEGTVILVESITRALNQMDFVSGVDVTPFDNFILLAAVRTLLNSSSYMAQPDKADVPEHKKLQHDHQGKLSVTGNRALWQIEQQTEGAAKREIGAGVAAAVKEPPRVSRAMQHRKQQMTPEQFVGNAQEAVSRVLNDLSIYYIRPAWRCLALSGDFRRMWNMELEAEGMDLRFEPGSTNNDSVLLVVCREALDKSRNVQEMGTYTYRRGDGDDKGKKGWNDDPDDPNRHGLLAAAKVD
ncbi:hypothetical protein DL771_011654 [Monosporascus sp. 5C6A]|nr:hypothetical protein DL771_011654 [Monosporascus sp. 5C6A]